MELILLLHMQLQDSTNYQMHYNMNEIISFVCKILNN
jgi:hypothetical protein